MIITCAATMCSNEFVYNPARPTQIYCKAECRLLSRTSKHSARKAKSDEHKTKFVAVDGEGVDVFWLEEQWDTSTEQLVMRRVRGHEYVLISVGDQSYHRDGAMLEHDEIFEFLYQQKLAHPDAAFVGFFLGYDFSQWLKSVRYSRARLLFSKEGIAERQPKNPNMKFPFPVYDNRWEYDILGMKRFKLRPLVRKNERPQCTVAHKTAELIDECASGKHNKHPYKWMYICDAGPFFQASLMSVLTGKWAKGTEVVTPDEIATLQEGKDNRASAQFDETMIKYNVLENDVLARLMNTVNEGFLADKIRLKADQWYGPGQAAQVWMRDVIKLPTGDEVREVVPDWAIEAARCSYYGGWFEITMHGPVPGTTYSYDINSAYPYAIAQLPCLLHGKWLRGSGKPPHLPRGAYQLIDARVIGKDEYIGSMPHRREDGGIVRPQKTSGWYWQHEIDASRAAGCIAIVSVDKWVRYLPCDCPSPVAAIADLYESRIRVGKNSPYGKSKKLVYNSAYGKFAQSIGQPRFANSLYASLITSHCRTMILRAISTHPGKTKAVAMVATDSVTFTSPHPTLDISEDTLGKWDVTPYENLSLMMPGLYWDDKARQAVREGTTPKLKSRGISARDLALFIDKIDSQWAKLIASGDGHFFTDEAPKVEINVAFSVISPKLAMVRNDWWLCGKVQWDQTRTLSANPISKRLGMHPAEDLPGVLRSSVWEFIPDEPRSTPYEKRFGDILDEIDEQRKELEEWLTPDGSIGISFKTWNQ